MKKFLQNLSMNMEDGPAAGLKDKCLNFIKVHPEIFCLSLLAFACFIFLFWGLNFYPLMDVDETRYAVMARDLFNSFDINSLMLNMSPFLEKPPLYFWIVGSSIKLFGGLSAFAVRFPIAILSTFIVFFTYYLGKRIIDRKFGVISALILLSSMFFLILSHIAIIDMVLTVFMTSAIYCALLTHFCEEKNKKFYWWYFYTFIGLGFLAKGILALAIPITIVFIYNFITKSAKEIFKPINLIPGFIIFLIMVVPWHFIMYQQYGFQFVKEYFLIHHFGRFMGSQYIGRERPLLYFIPVFLLGFMPWTFVFIAFLVNGYKKLAAKYKAVEGTVKDKLASLLVVSTNEQKLVLFCLIYFAVIFVVFSSSSTKLPTYILPIFPAAALLTGYYWWVSDEKEDNQKEITISTQIFAAVFIFGALAASVAYYILPFELQFKLLAFQQVTIIALYLLGILLLLRTNSKSALSVFAGYVFTMVFVIALAVSQIFNFVYSTGQNEIVNYSIISKRPNHASQLVTFDFAVKPSVLMDYNDHVEFITDPDFKSLDKLLEYKGGPTFVIVKNKNFADDAKYLNELNKRLELIQPGEKYSLFVKDIDNEYDASTKCAFGIMCPDYSLNNNSRMKPTGDHAVKRLKNPK